MGATAKPTADLYTDGIAFAERTGRLTDWRELLSLGLEPDSVSGGFFGEKAGVLLNFVQSDPEALRQISTALNLAQDQLCRSPDFNRCI